MEYKNMKISELREVARSQGLKGWMALMKNDLREFLINGVREPSTSRPKHVSMAEPSTSNTNVLLERIRKLEEENNRLRQRQTVPTLPPPLKPTPYEPPTLSGPIPKPRMKAKAAKRSWYD